MSVTSPSPSATTVNESSLMRLALVFLRSSLILQYSLPHSAGCSDAGPWTPGDDDGLEEDIPDTPESLPPYPSNGEVLCLKTLHLFLQCPV